MLDLHVILVQVLDTHLNQIGQIHGTLQAQVGCILCQLGDQPGGSESHPR